MLESVGIKVNACVSLNVQSLGEIARESWIVMDNTLNSEKEGQVNWIGGLRQCDSFLRPKGLSLLLWPPNFKL